jgi:hypothetical protein
VAAPKNPAKLLVKVAASGNVALDVLDLRDDETLPAPVVQAVLMAEGHARPLELPKKYRGSRAAACW